MLDGQRVDRERAARAARAAAAAAGSPARSCTSRCAVARDAATARPASGWSTGASCGRAFSSGRRPSRTGPSPREQRVGHEHGVLKAGQQQPLFERVAVDLEDPDRQAGFEPELAQAVGAFDVERAALCAPRRSASARGRRAGAPVRPVGSPSPAGRAAPAAPRSAGRDSAA